MSKVFLAWSIGFFILVCLTVGSMLNSAVEKESLVKSSCVEHGGVVIVGHGGKIYCVDKKAIIE